MWFDGSDLVVLVNIYPRNHIDEKMSLKGTKLFCEAEYLSGLFL